MDQAALDASIRRYYGSAWDENARIQDRSAGGQVEFRRTRALLSSRLIRPAAVLDVGGATGVHSAWLAEAGHRVTLVDPVAAQVRRAARLGTFTAVVGDARALPQPDASVDAVLLLGPLYHLIGEADRLLALREAARVLRDGGLLAAQGIGRLAALADDIRAAGHAAAAQDPELLATGRWVNSGDGFPGGHFHSAAELRCEIARAGFGPVTIHGLEGPTVGALELIPPDDIAVDAACQLATRLEAALAGDADRLDALADASPHLLAFATRVPRGAQAGADADDVTD